MRKAMIILGVVLMGVSMTIGYTTLRAWAFPVSMIGAVLALGALFSSPRSPKV
jgi:hypothetical protein